MIYASRAPLFCRDIIFFSEFDELIIWLIYSQNSFSFNTLSSALDAGRILSLAYMLAMPSYYGSHWSVTIESFLHIHYRNGMHEWQADTITRASYANIQSIYDDAITGGQSRDYRAARA